MGFRAPLVNPSPEAYERQRLTEDAIRDLGDSALEALREVNYLKSRCEELERELDLANLTIERLRRGS